MQPRNLRLLHGDMLRYCARAAGLVAEGFQRYREDEVQQLALQRTLQIVGEALTQAIRLDPDTVWRISESRKIVAFRHLLTHHYYRISPLIVWSIAVDDLPLLQREAQAAVELL